MNAAPNASSVDAGAWIATADKLVAEASSAAQLPLCCFSSYD